MVGGGGVDYGGIALVIGAGAAALAGVVNASLQVAIFMRQGREIRTNAMLHDAVNGQQKVLTDLIGKEAFGAGKLEGIEGERNRPPQP